MDAKEIIQRCSLLKNYWSTRRGKFADWYRILTLEDELAQAGTETVVSNDPRTSFNLARHLIVNSVISHKIPTDSLSNEQIVATSYLEQYMQKVWKHHDTRYRIMGKQGWLFDLVSLALMYGWVNIYKQATNDGLVAEVWHPAETFQRFGDNGTDEIAHVYSISAQSANAKAARMGWSLSKKFVANTILHDWWTYDNDGDVVNAIVLGDVMVKEPLKTGLDKIPITSIPVGGLPDTGVLAGARDWQKHYGESIVAVNEELSKNYNKMRSFAQQATRNAAQSNIFERSSGESPLVKESDIGKYGVIWHGGPSDDIHYVSPSPLPPELTQIMYTYQNELQRGWFPYSVFGNLQQNLSYLAMANVASAAMQTLTPFTQAIETALADVDNFWWSAIHEGVRPGGFKMPKDLPDEIEFEVGVNIEIPGYLVQRATVARMLNPSFQLDTTTVMDKLFPEIKDPIKEQAKVRATTAMMNPMAITVDSILEYRRHAARLKEARDMEASSLYTKLADALEASLIPQQQHAQPKQEAQSAMPKEIQELEATQ